MMSQLHTKCCVNLARYARRQNTDYKKVLLQKNPVDMHYDCINMSKNQKFLVEHKTEFSVV